jgi:AraC-like DNA-binding protein
MWGTSSEAAFNRAFKRLFGAPPARYRREHRFTEALAAKAQATVI